jgi:acetolactate decarboxylase
MKRVLALSLALILCVAGCTPPANDVLFQASTIDALLAGVFDSDVSCGDLLTHGDFGIGTFEGLDGEMVVLGGRVFQVRADGRVDQPADSVRTPFATVCRFQPADSFEIAATTNCAAVEQLLDQRAANQNVFYAIKITGRFTTVRTRSVPRQHKPYPTLKVAASQQAEFRMTDIRGTIVGFRCPAYAQGVNVPGYHLHFISSDRKRGGHVLDFELAAGRCEIEPLDRFFLQLPRGVPDFATADLTKDRAKDLRAVEK